MYLCALAAFAGCAGDDCPRFGAGAAFPAFVLDYDRGACQQLRVYERAFPELKGRLFLGNFTEKLRFRAYMSRDKFVEFGDSALSGDVQQFVHEFAYEQFGRWNPLVERMRIRRNLIFVVVVGSGLSNETKDMAVQRYGEKYLFGVADSAVVGDEVAGVGNETNLMFIASNDKTKYAIEKFGSDDEFLKKIENLDINRMKFVNRFKDQLTERENLKLKKTKYLLVISLTVICLTFWLIFHQSNDCINRNYIQPYALLNN